MPAFHSTNTTLDYVTFLIIYFLLFLLGDAFSLPAQPYVKIYRADRGNRNNELSPSATSSAAKPSREYADAFGPGVSIRRSLPYAKNGAKRGLDIGVQINIATTPRSTSRLEKLQEVLEKALGGNLAEVLNASSCPQCEDESGEPLVPEKRRVKPAYKCDEWDAKYRLCILERNIGDTVTFYLSTGDPSRHKLSITWKKEFHTQDSKSRTEFVIEPENCPENIIIGKQGYELRISPITETDVGYNLFSAALSGHHSAQSKIFYMIRIVPIDLGFVYVGETIELSLRSHVSLPAASLSYVWYMEKYGEHSTLPSNMRTSVAGSSIKISELRQEQEGVLACSVYTNLKFLATKKRFLMRDLVKNNDVLKSPPDHNLHFKEERPVRGIQGFKKPARHKRSINIDDIVEKALMESTTAGERIQDVTRSETSSHSFDDYDVERDLENGDSPAKTYTDIPESSYESDSRYEDTNPGFGVDSQHSQEADIAIGSKASDLEEDIADQFSASKEQSDSGLAIPESPLEDGRELARSYPPQKLEADLEISPLLDFPSKQKTDGDKSYSDVEFGNGKDNYDTQAEDSGIILNIDKIPAPRRTSAEIKIAKLISFCNSDLECSGAATCVKSSLNQKGFCKCLPGFYGVGIFCREDIWLSEDKLNVEQFNSPEDLPYSNVLPLTGKKI